MSSWRVFFESKGGSGTTGGVGRRFGTLRAHPEGLHLIFGYRPGQRRSKSIEAFFFPETLCPTLLLEPPGLAIFD